MRRQRRCLLWSLGIMRSFIFKLAVGFSAVALVWAVTQLRVVHVEQFCAGLKEWRVTFRQADSQNLSLTPGIYVATSYSLTNAFGLAGVERTSIVVSPDVYE